MDKTGVLTKLVLRLSSHDSRHTGQLLDSVLVPYNHLPNIMAEV